MTLIIILGLLVLIGIGTAAFVNFHPVFGGTIKKENYSSSENFENGLFKNQIETDMSMDMMEAIKMIPEFFKKAPGRQPDFELPVQKIDSLDMVNATDSTAELTWFGHSAFFLNIEGKKVLIDPMFGDSPSPIGFMGNKRYASELPIEIEQMPEIDLVVFSHDHYDHLDYPSVLRLKDKVKQWFVPLGLESHLVKWGVDASKIKAFDWWEEAEYMNLKLVSTPARHFSGRGLADRYSTLWSSWVIMGQNSKIYFSGDSGYGPHFKEIGEKYGPFDISLTECGQYNERWSNIHMMPEETIQAGIDVKANKIMPIHWGAFTLAMHTWTDPVERASLEAKRLNVPLIIPKIGETFEVKNSSTQNNYWWQK
ncbi:MBL fold metallo-hydrolase [Jiulongibacter sp. NS-SX5]|uniref:MBL fold metallo-hydrolase n=1 Tax=Jiulongibacter sp. NS-SX5 TaxID=3463854 RepID=UPI004059FB74